MTRSVNAFTLVVSGELVVGFLLLKIYQMLDLFLHLLISFIVFFFFCLIMALNYHFIGPHIERSIEQQVPQSGLTVDVFICLI